jgi:hypothetical protein
LRFGIDIVHRLIKVDALAAALMVRKGPAASFAAAEKGTHGA